MAGPKQPIELVVMNGKKHLTKAEIEERRSSEVQGLTDGIAAPSFLTPKQRKRFDIIADQLLRIGIMSSTDNETLARYVVAQELYEQAVKDLRQTQKDRPKNATAEDLIEWAALLNILDKRVDRYYKQATAAASKLGLTISDRCKLVVPKGAEAPKANKFEKFSKVAGSK